MNDKAYVHFIGAIFYAKLILNLLEITSPHFRHLEKKGNIVLFNLSLHKNLCIKLVCFVGIFFTEDLPRLDEVYDH